MLKTEDIRLLGRLALFSGVEPRDAARTCTHVEAAAGIPIGAVAARPDSVWIVARGLIQLDTVWPGGEQMIVDIAAPGGVFGRLDGSVPPGLQAVPFTDAALIELPHAAYRRLLRESPEFARNIGRYLAEALAESQSLRALFALPARARLIRILLWLRGKLGPEIPLTRRALADVAAVTPETAIRALSPLEKRGFIRTRPGRVNVPDARRLARLVER